MGYSLACGRLAFKALYSAIVYAANDMICAGVLLQLMLPRPKVNDAKTYYQIIRVSELEELTYQLPLNRIAPVDVP